MSKKITIYSLFGLLFIPHLVLAATPKPIVVGVQDKGTLGRAEFGQLLNALTILGRASEKETGHPFRLDNYANSAIFDTQVKQRVPDLLLHNSTLAASHGYKPFMAYAPFNEKGPRECLLASKNHKTGIPGLKGKVVMTKRPGGARYMNLSKVIKTDPLSFFKFVKPGKNDASMVYALAMGQVDAAWVDMWAYQVLIMSNPGPKSKIQTLACTSFCPQFFMVSPKLDPK